MKNLKTMLEKTLQLAFEEAGYARKDVEVKLSRRPDLCDYQCNSALKIGNEEKQSPIDIANNVVEYLLNSAMFEKVEACKPGFINLSLSKAWMATYLKALVEDPKHGVEQAEEAHKIIVDFGGANVAKSLHVGHLRSAVIGQSLINLLRQCGHDVIGDIHMGDWGLQIGLVIEMLRRKDNNLVYFTDANLEVYPKEAPFTIEGLTSIYTEANVLSKEDEGFRKSAEATTAELQRGHKAYRALWQHILRISKEDLKKNYGSLQVHFDLWLGESDAEKAIPEVIKILEDRKLLVDDQNAKVVFVNEETDNKPMPPVIIQKHNGASLYATTDLTTIYQRMHNYQPDEIIYVVDKRQALHFEQVERVARKAEIIGEEVELSFINFGTMNGTDGKPFKTRDGGVMQLNDLISMLISNSKDKLETYSHLKDESLKDKVALAIGVGALKFGDLMNQPSRDFCFDLQQFSNFEGKTGTYVQYANVRVHSLIDKLKSQGINPTFKAGETLAERNIAVKLLAFGDTVSIAASLHQPSKLCEYVFELSQLVNTLYHDVHIQSLASERQAVMMGLLMATESVLSTSLTLLGIEAITQM